MDKWKIKFLYLQNERKEPQPTLKLDVQRPVLEEQDLRLLYQYEKPKESVIQSVKKIVRNSNCKKCIQSTIPATYWLRKYKWKNDFIYDTISGITVAIMHIPQGMAYALLGNLTPVVGIYMAFFPVLMYFFLGTSRHVSMGTFAVVCLMTGKTVSTYATHTDTINYYLANNMTRQEGYHLLNNSNNVEIYTPVQVATAVTFMVGLFQIIMYIFRLGAISTLLNEVLVNGFISGAAVQVLLSQVYDLIGLDTKKPKGYFKLIKMIVIIFTDISLMNKNALIISLITCSIMIFNNQFIAPWLSKRCSFPVPIELVAVIVGALVSRFFELPTLYGIKVVGHIPPGIPEPQLPAFNLLPKIALDSFAITIISYTVTMSMSLIFAKKLHYEVDSNQELLAMGGSNLFSAFFCCMPVSASLSRSLIQQRVGGKSQLASIVSCLLLLVILLWIGPFFEPLPRCVLASIIVVALKGILVQAKDSIKFWKLSKVDGLVWTVTFLSTMLIGIDVGLIIGLLASITSIFIQSVRPYSCLLGHVPNTELYLDTSRYIGVAEIFGVKIFHYSGSLSFANASQLGPNIQAKVGVEPRKILKYRAKLMKRNGNAYAESSEFENRCTLRCIVVDMSAVSSIDSAGVAALHDVVSEFASIDVPVYLAGCLGSVYDLIHKCDILKIGELGFTVFATVHDAVFFAQRELC
ncbi:solute carrier family 26 member 10 isoform X2 [Copidosoma floridanum]|uniref:solute carrier family 26 member 10 isoform X2 n=1 Tax=Copidosoma floridanum TaxID=29053 RepID=UPI0006C97E52|nr:solute carrier family 26 member 10 isoform X2 [Copidosoma floridanum]